MTKPSLATTPVNLVPEGPSHPRWLTGLLLCWLALVLTTVFFARELQSLVLWGWPLGYWMAAQGVVLGFIAIVVVHAWVMRRLERPADSRAADSAGSEREN